ncbi:MAG: hypothetical protein AAGA10_28350, partial [Bacteroidota bacterium]
SLPDMTRNLEWFEKEGNPLTPAYRYHQKLHAGQKKILAQSGFAKLYPDMQQYYLDQQQIHGASNKRMIEAVRANPEVDGYCIHALAAGDWRMGAGLIDLWRSPKTYAYEGTKAANQPRIVSIRTHPRNIYAQEGGNLEILGINDLEAIPAELQIEIQNSKGEVVYQNTQKVNWISGVSELYKDVLETNTWNGTYTTHIKMLGQRGQIITQNTYPMDVFTEESLEFPSMEIALLGPKKRLKTYLEDQSISVSTFTKSTSNSTPVLVTGTLGDGPKDKSDFPQLFEFVRKGGTAVYIEGANQIIEQENSIFPFTADPHPAVGLWTCIPHLVHKHPVFNGLPSQGPMREIYENVWARKTLRGLAIESSQAVETVVGSMGFEWFSRDHKFHYSGPGSAWWGSDLAIFSMGEGTIIVSQLELLPHLGSDPVADKILANLLRFVKVPSR